MSGQDIAWSRSLSHVPHEWGSTCQLSSHYWKHSGFGHRDSLLARAGSSTDDDLPLAVNSIKCSVLMCPRLDVAQTLYEEAGRLKAAWAFHSSAEQCVEKLRTAVELCKSHKLNQNCITGNAESKCLDYNYHFKWSECFLWLSSECEWVTDTARLRSTPGAVAFTKSSRCADQYERLSAAEGHFWLIDEASSLSEATYWSPWVTTKLGCKHRKQMYKVLLQLSP